ncbi:MAG: hypothetical protein ACRC6V_04415 [Bacteroidales bacterium]
MNKIYRLRPTNETTLSELTEPYLWFSRPTEYRDVEDANVIAFSEENVTVKDLFDRVFGNDNTLGIELSRLGICCFTKSLPEVSIWGKFPKGNGAIFIEYDKEKLKDFFIKKFALGDCFKEVHYKEQPLSMISSDGNGYDVEWEKKEDGIFYKSLRGDIARNQKSMDQFILQFITTINKKFEDQNEERVILPYRAIKDKPRTDLGYKINIPKESIVKIYYTPKTDPSFVEKLEELNFILKLVE